MTQTTIETLAGALAQAYPADQVVDFAVGDWRVRIVTNSPKLKQLVGDYLRLFRVQDFAGTTIDTTIAAYECDIEAVSLMPTSFVDWKRDPGKSGRKEAIADLDDGWVVRKVRTGMHFLPNAETRVAFGPCETNFIQVVNFLNIQYIAWLMRQDWVLCHAAGVARNKRGLGIAGMSGAGKSSLALTIVNEGTSFVSNDRLLIKADPLRMSGVPKHPRINPGTVLNNDRLSSVIPAGRRNELLAMDNDELWDLEEKYDADIETLYGGKWDMTAAMAGFVILNWKRELAAPPVMKRVAWAERDDLWPAVMKTPGPLWVGPDGNRANNTPSAPPEPYLRVMAEVPLYEVTGGVDFEAACRACLELI